MTNGWLEVSSRACQPQQAPVVPTSTLSWSPPSPWCPPRPGWQQRDTPQQYYYWRTTFSLWYSSIFLVEISSVEVKMPTFESPATERCPTWQLQRGTWQGQGCRTGRAGRWWSGPGTGWGGVLFHWYLLVGHCQEDRNPFTSSLSLELSTTHVCVKYQKQHSQQMFPLGKWRHQQLLVYKTFIRHHLA